MVGESTNLPISSTGATKEAPGQQPTTTQLTANGDNKPEKPSEVTTTTTTKALEPKKPESNLSGSRSRSRSRDREQRRRRRRSRSSSSRSRYRRRRRRSRSYDRHSSKSRRRSASRELSRSHRDHSQSRSRDRDRRRRSRSRSDRDRKERRRRKRSRSHSRSKKKSKKRSKSKKKEENSDDSDDAAENSEDGMTEEQKLHKHELEKLTRDARTVFVSQLQVKVTEKDLKKFFQAVCDVKDVVLIRDRFTNRSKGFGYVEVKTLEDVPKALMLTGQRFIFRNGKQGFPISVKASEAEKNFTHQLEKRVASLSSAPTGAQLSGDGGTAGPAGGSSLPLSMRPGAKGRELLTDEEWDDRLVVTNVHPNIQEAQLRELCSSFGSLVKLELAQDREGKRNGSANIYFEQSIDAMKAFKELNGLELAGLTLGVSKMRKTPSERAQERKSTKRVELEEYRKENMDARSWRLEDDDVDVGRIGGGGVSMNSHTRASLMSKLGGGLGEDMLQQSTVVPEKPVEKKEAGPGRILGVASRYLCIKNMFDPREETEQNWEEAIADDTKAECENFGKVLHCAVDNQSAGHVYIMFDTINAGVDASHALHGRWFAKRMVQVEYLKQDVYEAKYPVVKAL